VRRGPGWAAKHVIPGAPADAAEKRAGPWWIEREGTSVVKVNRQFIP
jgi:hypothetical protein